MRPNLHLIQGGKPEPTWPELAGAVLYIGAMLAFLGVLLWMMPG